MDRHLRGVLSIFRDETALYICLRYLSMFHWIYYRTALIVFLSPIYISSKLVLKRSKINHFSRLHGSSFTRRFVSISWNKTALYICLCYVTISPQVLHKTSYMIFLSPIYIFLKSCSKGPILTIFLGRMDRHLHGVLSISRDETGFYICLRYVTMCRQIYHRKMLMIFLSPIYISSQILLRRPNIDYFSRSRGSSLTRRFGY